MTINNPSNPSTEDAVYGVALTMLGDAVAAIVNGKDVAPAQRLRIEALLEQALRDRAVSVEQLLAAAQAMLPPPAALHVTENSMKVELELWQKRAPVAPSTKN